MVKRWGGTVALAAMLSACGGSDGGSTSAAPVASVPVTATPTPTPVASAGCSLRQRQDWVLAQMREWYLFPETLPANLDPTPYTTVSDYLDALTATARSQRRDRFFTYLTSIKEEDAFYNSGSSAGFGFRLTADAAGQRVFIAETFEATPALAAGIDRGAEIVAIGTTSANLRTVSAIIASSGLQGVTDALGPNTAGTTRVLRIADANGTREVSVAKTDYSLTPVSSRYGAKVITEGGKRYGYVNLRTFINTADPALRAAFQQFRDQGVTDVVVDLRYNGGGLVSIAELMGDLLGANRGTSDVFSFTTFRPEKAAENGTKFFAAQAQAIAPTRLAFIGTGGTASASELVINAFTPYLHKNSALIGGNTFGKPVGQIALDQPTCDDRLRVIAFALQNSARQGAYFDGLASTVEASCKASDDLTHQLGDPQEASTRSALDFLQGKTCTPITATATGDASAQSMSTGNASAQSISTGQRELLTPARPNTQQREAPGLF